MTAPELAELLRLALVGGVAAAAALLSLFSGFGLGTLLLPAFVVFFPVPVAVAATAVVHLLQNLLKTGLLWRDAHPPALWRFGIPAVLAAPVGAALLARLPGDEVLASWRHGALEGAVTPVGLVMGLVIVAFGVLELGPGRRALRLSPRWLPAGGLLSGFFGGLSGHQGALRAAFLAPLGLAPAAYAATQAVLACAVDVARLTAYALAAGTGHLARWRELEAAPVVVATACAFAAIVLGRRALPTVSRAFVHRLVGGLLLAMGAALAAGLL